MIAVRFGKVYLALFSLVFVFFAGAVNAEQGSLWGGKSGGLNLFESSEPEFLPVDEAFVFQSEVTGRDELTLRWKVTDGYYLYQNRLSVKDSNGNTLPFVTSEGRSVTKDDPAFGLVEVFYDGWAVTVSPEKAGDLKVRYQGCADAGLCYPPTTRDAYWDGKAASSFGESPVGSDKPQDVALLSESSSLSKDAVLSKEVKALASGASGNGVSTLGQDGLFWTLLLFFGIGLGLAFTPCVLPMLPILSSVVVNHQGESKGSPAIAALVYVLGMAITYSALGVAMAGLGDAVQMQAWLQQPVVVGVFAAIFVALALSMFGLYELQLPEVLRNRLLGVGDGSRNHGLIGCLVLGVISALVVSPCVSGPLAGVLIYISTTQDMFLGGAALFSMALGMGLPLVAIVLGGRNALPKAGAWMEQVKALFGVMLLLMALYLVKHLLSVEVLALIAGAILFVYAVWAGALSSATNGLYRGVVLVVLMYSMSLLASGFSGRASFFEPLGFFASTSGSVENQSVELNAITVSTGQDLSLALESAKAAGKPVMLDVLADWCVSCFVMEEEILKRPDVISMMSAVELIKVDITDVTPENAAFLKAQQLFGPPAFLFYDAKGDQVGRIVGEVNKQEFKAYFNDLVL